MRTENRTIRRPDHSSPPKKPIHTVNYIENLRALKNHITAEVVFQNLMKNKAKEPKPECIHSSTIVHVILLHIGRVIFFQNLKTRGSWLIPMSKFQEIRIARAVTSVVRMCCGLAAALHFILSFATSSSKSLTSVKRKAVFPLVLMLTPLLAGSPLSTPVTYGTKDT